MNINQLKRVLDAEGVWYSVIKENDDICIDEMTTVPQLCSDMHRKILVLTTGNIKEAERSAEDWSGFVNVILDGGCSKKYLRKLSAPNLILVGKNDIGRTIGALHEALRNNR
jgi:hypothetical protein